ncbi:MAG: 3-deoxy-7-phosphoheptulonate synthase [Deltaproteobacteria bacterium]|nr:MAG: 3-deoxy-7-phosphoheptulonate synthase [Deltaproteobacteria bacterium]
MLHITDDVRIESLRPLLPAAILLEEIPISDAGEAFVAAKRAELGRVLRGEDDRLVVVVGPCSVHDPGAALDYADRLRALSDRLAEDLLVVMRVYFEKPRTTVGWKGLINDPRLDGTFEINTGLRLARRLLRDLSERGVPAGCEFLDTITPQFTADLVTWGAIGARTTESQVHRELASGLSVPVGFKNGTGGSIKMAVDAVRAARDPHHFLSVTKQGLAAIVATRGNPECHVILRGASSGPNFDAATVASTVTLLEAVGAEPRVMVDCSHGNSSKDHRRQPEVARDIATRIAAGDRSIFGLMLESHLVGGRQDHQPGVELTYGQSITDACLAWDETVPVLEELAAAVRARRA